MTATFYAGAQLSHHKTNIGVKDCLCVYCKGAHSATNCNIITDHHKWVEYIKREGLCFNCLAKHRVAQCTSCNGCKQCTCKHHTSICKAYSYRPPLTNAQPSIQSSQSTKTCIPDTKQTTTSPIVSTTQALNPPTPVTTTLTSNQQYPVLLHSCDSVNFFENSQV